MKGKFRVISGASNYVENTLNELMEDNFVRVISSSGTSKDLTVVAYLKPNIEK